MAPSLKCSPWRIDMDDFWQSHPDWEPSDVHTNDTHTCFEPIRDPDRAAFFRSVHANQFVGVSSMTGSHPPPGTTTNDRCDPQIEKRRQGLAIRPLVQAGFAATVLFLQRNAFWSAYRQNRTFQHAIPTPSFVWHYLPSEGYKNDTPSTSTKASSTNTATTNNNNTNTTNWPSCPSNDMDCYFLPITNCPRPVGPEGVTWKAYGLDHKLVWRDIKKNKTLEVQQVWLSSYMMRPRQETRKRLYELTKREAPNDLQAPCTWMHVRRADAMTEGKTYPRNFYSIQEYLDRGSIPWNETIYLLTDDDSAIEEALALHPEYHWVVWNRTRYRGPQSYNQHFPSHDKGLETLRLLAETKLAGRCRKGVHGDSNLVRMMKLAMTLEHGHANIETILIDRRLKTKRVEATDFMKDLETKLAAAAAAAAVVETPK